MGVSVNWEEGLRCASCHGLIPLGSDMLYGKHLACVQSKSTARRAAATGGDTLSAVRQQLGLPGHITLTSGQLRELIALVTACGIEPLHRPDRGRRLRWYARLPGWSEERVAAGLDAAGVAGLWKDFLAVGRLPPLRHADIATVLDAMAPAQKQ